MRSSRSPHLAVRGLLARDLRGDWLHVCSEVYDDLVAGIPGPPLRWYGATNPGEFCSVATELFFEQARELQEREPARYGVLRRFYRQDPAVRESPARDPDHGSR